MSFQYDVSVVVPIYNVEEYLEECLDSIQNQTLESLEVVLVDDGSTDSSGVIAKQYADRFSNFKYFHKENGGLGHARNYGTDRAQGEYITYCDSDDIIPSYAYEKMYRLAKKWNCDIVSGDVDRFNSRKHYPSSLHELAFEKVSEHQNVFENPKLLFDTIAPNKIYKASFLKSTGIRFPEDMLYEDIPAVIPLVCSTRRFAHLNEIVYNWRAREDAGDKSITQRRTEWKNFSDRLKALRMVDEFFDKNITDARLRAEKEFKWLSVDLRMFVNALNKADDEYKEQFVDVVVPYLDGFSEEAFSRLRAVDRIKYYYLRNRDIDGLMSYFDFAFNGAAYRAIPIRKRNGRYYGKFPFRVPMEYMDMTNEIQRNGCAISVANARISSENGLSLAGDVFLRRFSSLEKDSIEIQACLVSDEDGAVVGSIPSACNVNEQKATKWERCFKYGFVRRIQREKNRYEIEVEWQTIKSLPPGSYHIELNYRCNDILCDSLYLAYPSKNDDAYPYPVYDGSRRYFIRYDVHSCLRIVVEECDYPVIDRVDVSDDGIRLFCNCAEIDKYLLGSDRSLGFLSELVKGINAHRYVCSFESDLIHSISNMAVRVRTNPEGYLVLEAYPNSMVSQYASFEGDVFNYLVGPMDGCEPPENATPVFLGDRTKKIVQCSHFSRQPDGIIQCSIDVSNAHVSKALQCDTYRLHIAAPGIAEPVPEDGSSLMPVLSRKRRSVITKKPKKQKYKYSLTLNGREGFAVSLGWNSYESTKHRRDVMSKRVYEPIYKIARVLLPLKKNMVLFESYWGTQIGCNPAGLSSFIAKNHPEMECVWSVVDERMPVEGGVKLIRKGTFPYYMSLARTHYLVNNVNFENWYKKRRGQIEIQTTHGTPLKTVGFAAPDEFSSDKALEDFAKRCERWDYLIAPGPSVKDILRSNYHFQKRFLETGFPRNDALFERNNVTEISNLKRKTGIPENKKVILYAPTWRVKNKFDLKLDFSKLLDELGDEYILGFRPHHFSMPGIDWDDLDSRVHNLASGVTSEDCYLISDIVITDYSSLMFDVALLRKPLLFFVYDLEEYRDQLRGFNLDFEAEAPGPLLLTSDEVIEAIRRIDALEKEYGDAYETFRNNYCGYENGHASERIYKEVFSSSN